MRVLYIGGTGEVSYGGIEASLQLGHEVFVFNRGTSGVPLPAGARGIRGDVNNSASYAALGRESWDAVCQFRTFTPDDVRRDVETFAGATSQFVFISSASAYQKPQQSHVVSDAWRAIGPIRRSMRSSIESSLSSERLNNFRAPALRDTAVFRSMSQ